MLEVVIFDLDGLLIDSEPLQYRAYKEAFAMHGITIELDDWPLWHRLEASAARWLQHFGLQGDAERIRDSKKVIYDRLIERELALKPGAQTLVRTLAEHFRLCVASGSRLESIDACVEKFNLGGCFEASFSATTQARKKPYPDVYRHALRQMGCDAGSALAIEDSVTGLQAARAAHIPCIVCPDSFMPVEVYGYEDAALVVESLEQLSLARVCGISAKVRA
ncbi:MAG: HAD-IA family hydrolase [Gammaproteobacteria bacterium]|nr:HAD-IA family hydrolase [Gammaproteobacteria bacterium]